MQGTFISLYCADSNKISCLNLDIYVVYEELLDVANAAGDI